MANPVVGAIQILQTAGVGTLGASSGWGLFGGALPDTPNNAIAVMQSGGLQPWAGYALDFPQIQVLVRSDAAAYLTGRTKANAVKDALLGIDPQTADGDDWWGVTMISDITELGRDKQSRFLFSLNFQVFLAPANTGNREVI